MHAQLIHEKTSEPLDLAQGECQAGFRKYRRAIDNTPAVKIIAQELRRSEKQLLLPFIDLQQAFDKVPRKLIQRAFACYGVPSELQAKFWALYKGRTFLAKREGARSGKTRTTAGTKQGRLLSPIIFNMVMAYLLLHTDKGKGVSWSTRKVTEKDKQQAGGEDPTHLLYADVIAFFSQSWEELVETVEELRGTFKRFGLCINDGETKYPITNPQGEHPEKIGGIERVEEFIYLGTKITADNDDTPDAELRTQKAQKQAGQLGNICNSNKVSTKLKRKALRAFIFPVLAWGSATWILNKKQADALDTFWNKKRRHCVGVTKHDHGRTEDICAELGEEPRAAKINRLRLRYFGHVVRYPESRWVRKLITATTSTTTRTKKKGKPRESWLDRISKELVARNARAEDCLNRERWKNIIENKDRGTRIDFTITEPFELTREHSIQEIRKAEGWQRFGEVVGTIPS